MMTTYRYSFALPSMRGALSFVCALVFALSPSFLNAQQPAKVFRIGELVFRGDRLNLGAGRELFRRALGELGYVEGKNIAFEIRSAGGNPDRFPTLAEELVRLEVDVLIASSVNEVLTFKSATKKIPIVMMSVGADPVEAGLVQSLARPGGNVTGVTDFATEISAKRLELLKEARPTTVRVAVLYDPKNRGNLRQVKEVLPVAAARLGLTLQPLQVRGADDFDIAFDELQKERSDAVFVPGGSLLVANQKRIAALALQSRMASIFERREAVESGGLMSYGADRVHLYRRAAYFVDRIIKGAPPTELPVEQPTKFEMAVNLKTAKQIGVTIPSTVLARADRVIR